MLLRRIDPRHKGQRLPRRSFPRHGLEAAKPSDPTDETQACQQKTEWATGHWPEQSESPPKSEHCPVARVNQDTERMLCLFCRVRAQSQISVDLGKIKKCDTSCTAVCELKSIPIQVGIWNGCRPPPFKGTVLVPREYKLRHSSLLRELCLTSLNK